MSKCVRSHLLMAVALLGFSAAVCGQSSGASAPSEAQAVRPRLAGSLFSEGQYQALTSDRRVFRQGDVLTILLAESASATSAADTGSGREAEVGLSAQGSGPRHSAGVSTRNEFSASGRTQRTGRLMGQLSVTVLHVHGNGDLQVVGEQTLDINGERQRIRAEGRVRPRDINEQNVVLSGRIADAKLSYQGQGVLGDQRPGWWQRVLTAFGL